MRHDTHSMHDNSLAAYRSEETRLSKRCEAVYAWISAHGPATDREVMTGMGFTDPNAVRPRITELSQRGRLMEVGAITCPVTSKTVRRVDIRRARQAGLFP